MSKNTENIENTETKKYMIRVFNDDPDRPDSKVYLVIACSVIDARVMAFILDGGADPLNEPDAATVVALAREWTKFIKEIPK